MILPVNAKYRIAADALSWSIQKSRKRNGTVVWEGFQWYASLPQAVNALGDLMVRTSNAETLAEALAEVEMVATTLSQALTPRFEVTVRRRGSAEDSDP